MRYAHEHGTTVLWGRCDEELSVPFEPFAEALRHYVACVPADRVKAELGSLGGELTRILPDLSARVPGLAAPVQTDPETERHRLFEAVSDFLAAMSHTDPVILVLDDIHWADKPSLLMLRHILRSGSPMRLFVLATYRDTDLDRSHPLSDVLADLRRQAGVDRLDLGGLGPAEVTSFMEAAAGHELDEAGLALAQAVFAETQGNPFFVGEVLRHLAESGAIVQRDGRWISDKTLEEVGIPEGIREVLGRRLSRLSETANKALAIAAVIGATFDLATIEAAGGPTGDELFDALDEAAVASVVREVPGTVGRYTFAHALVRSALYEELHDEPPRAHALADRRSARGALRAAPRRAPRRARVPVHRRRARRRSAARPSTTAAGPASTPRPSSRSRRPRSTSSGRSPRSSSSTTPIRRSAATCRSRSRRRSTTRATSARRDAMFAAATSARALGDADRLARAALDHSRATSVDTTSTSSCRPARGSARRHRRRTVGGAGALMIGLAVQLQWGPEVERRMRSLAMRSRSHARPATRTRSRWCSRAGWALIDGSMPFLDELQALNDEAGAVAREVGDPVRLAEALHYRRVRRRVPRRSGDGRGEDRRGGAHLRSAAPAHASTGSRPQRRRRAPSTTASWTAAEQLARTRRSSTAAAPTSPRTRS